MTHSDYFRRPSGQTLYAKPLPLVVAPWAADTIAATENASTGSYAFTGLADNRDYEIFRQLGVTPASSDTAIGAFPKPVDTSGIDLLLDRVTGLTGPLVVALKIQDEEGGPIYQARVRLSKLGDTQSKLTDPSGLAQFACENGVWTVAITAAGYASQLHTININDDLQVSYALLAIAVSLPVNPQVCVVQIFARHNGVLLQGAVCKARLKSTNSAIGGTVISTQITESVTNANGYAELQLIRASQFVDGDGQYVVEVWHGDRRFVSVNVTIPDQDSINLEELIVATSGA